MAVHSSLLASYAPFNPLRLEIEDYLHNVISDVQFRTLNPSGKVAASEVPEKVFSILTSQRYCYLGRRKSEPYKELVESQLAKNVSRNESLAFYYDLGPGYHAGISRQDRSLSFEVSLSELLALRQMILFANEVQNVYPLGVQFHVVIDNLCGLYTNDIALENSTAYVNSFRQLIREVGASDIVSLLVESEQFSCERYEAILATVEEEAPADAVSEADIDNIARFLGRECTEQEAASRIERYRRTGITTETLLAEKIGGVRLTQRASANTLAFRAFSGGDQRTQAGQLVLTRSSKGKLRPTLLTTHNSEKYSLLELAAHDTMPEPISTIIFADTQKPSF